MFKITVNYILIAENKNFNIKIELMFDNNIAKNGLFYGHQKLGTQFL